MNRPQILAIVAGALAVIGMIWPTYPLLHVSVLLLSVAVYLIRAS